MSKNLKAFYHSHITFLCLRSFRIMFKDKKKSLMQHGNNNKLSVIKNDGCDSSHCFGMRLLRQTDRTQNLILQTKQKKILMDQHSSMVERPRQKSWICQCMTWLNTKYVKNRHSICSNYYHGQGLKKPPSHSAFTLYKLQSVSHPTICKSRDICNKTQVCNT